VRASEAILEILARRRGVDFRDYRAATVERGIELRVMTVAAGDAAAYLAHLEEDGSEVDRLIEAVVIPVTSFFRDAEVFAALRQTVVPALFARAASAVRAWVAGAATGEEAWSIAMLLAAESERARGRAFQVIASDLERGGLEVARAGIYEAAVAAGVPPELRERFLRAHGPLWRVADDLRGRACFSQHDLLGNTLAPVDAVIASFALVSCRNVLIYFDRRLQEKALAKLLAALEPGGALVLGPVETLPAAAAARLAPFPGTDPALRIFRLREGR
jgi:two-component system CheB/CheR fusion protein